MKEKIFETFKNHFIAIEDYEENENSIRISINRYLLLRSDQLNEIEKEVGKWFYVESYNEQIVFTWIL